MAAVTVRSDFLAQEEEIWHYFHLFPLYVPWNNQAIYFFNTKLSTNDLTVDICGKCHAVIFFWWKELIIKK